jgi:hypothetical protein
MSNSYCYSGRILTKQIPLDSPLKALRVWLWTQVDWMMSSAANSFKWRCRGGALFR